MAETVTLQRNDGEAEYIDEQGQRWVLVKPHVWRYLTLAVRRWAETCIGACDVEDAQAAAERVLGDTEMGEGGQW